MATTAPSRRPAVLPMRWRASRVPARAAVLAEHDRVHDTPGASLRTDQRGAAHELLDEVHVSGHTGTDELQWAVSTFAPDGMRRLLLDPDERRRHSDLVHFAPLLQQSCWRLGLNPDDATWDPEAAPIPLDLDAWAAERAAADPDAIEEWRWSVWNPAYHLSRHMPAIRQLWPTVLAAYQAEAAAEGVDLTPTLLALLRNPALSACLPPGWASGLQLPGLVAALARTPETHPEVLRLRRERSPLLRGLLSTPAGGGPMSDRQFLDTCRRLSRAAPDDLPGFLATVGPGEGRAELLGHWLVQCLMTDHDVELQVALVPCLEMPGWELSPAQLRAVELWIEAHPSPKHLGILAPYRDFARQPGIWSRMRRSRQPEVLQAVLYHARGPELRDVLGDFVKRGRTDLLDDLDMVRPEHLVGLTRADLAPLLAQTTHRGLRLWATQAAATLPPSSTPAHSPAPSSRTRR